MIGTPDKERRPSRNENTYMCEAWLGMVVWSSARKEVGPDSHFVEDFRGDLKLWNEENTGLAAVEVSPCSWSLKLLTILDASVQISCIYISFCSGGLPSSPSTPLSQAEFSDPRAGPAITLGSVYLHVSSLSPIRLDSQGLDLAGCFCPDIEKMFSKCILNECLQN